MRRHSSELCPVHITYGPLSIACSRPEGHDGAHAGNAVAWTDTAAARAAEDPPTERLPPIGETVRRRPPVPAPVRELKGSALLRALADELDADGLGGEDL